MPLELVSPMVEALKMTPQELLSFFELKSEWLSQQAQGYEFNDEETRLFQEIVKYVMKIRNSADYEENLNCLFALMRQLNK